MNSILGRREMLSTIAAAAVIAFDPTSRSWVTEARAAGSSIAIPSLDGQLVTDPASLTEAADDFGHIIHRTPIAVLRPGSVRDIEKLIQFAFRHGLKVAMRGQGHARFGQAEAGGGVVIDSRTLATIHDISPNGAVVDAGVLWFDVVNAAVAQGLTVPVLNDFLQLSVGGTLSVGGFGGSTHREGLQVDNVLELEVVTGEGKLVRCSPTHKAGLFNAALGGLGNFGVIVKATLRLVPAPESVRENDLAYLDLATFMDDARLVVSDGRFNHVTGSGAFTSTGLGFQLQTASFFTPPEQPDDAALLDDLHPLAVTTTEQDYLTWTNRTAAIVELQKQLGIWGLPHPWVDLFVPDSAADAFVSNVLSTLTPADTGNGPIFLFPFTTQKLTRRFVEIPNEDIVFVFSVLRLAPTVDVAQGMVTANRALFERARNVGATLYPIDAVPMSRADWIRQYGSDFPAFLAAKIEFDPGLVLAPGYGLFAPIS